MTHNRNSWSKRGIALTLVVLMLLMMLSGCSGKESETEAPNGQGDGSQSDSAPDVIQFAALYPLTGANATTGTNMSNGIRLAVDIINGEYDIADLPGAKTAGIQSMGGAKLEAVFGDTQGDPQKGMSTAEQVLTDNAHAVAVVGCLNSAVAATIGTVTERLGKVFITPDCVNPGLCENGWQYFFRATPDSNMFISNEVEFLVDMNKEKNADIHTVALFYDNSLNGNDFHDLIKPILTENGFEVVEEVCFAANSAELTSEVQKLKRADADVVISAAYLSDMILFTKTCKEQNYAPEMLLVDGGIAQAEYSETLGADSDYGVNRSGFMTDLAETKPAMKAVDEMYYERHGIHMDEDSARAFMGVIILSDALERAGSTDTEALRLALKETELTGEQCILAWDGVAFDERGQNVLGRGLMGQLFGGTLKTVWPFELASEEIVYPQPAWNDR